MTTTLPTFARDDHDYPSTSNTQDDAQAHRDFARKLQARQCAGQAIVAYCNTEPVRMWTCNVEGFDRARAMTRAWQDNAIEGFSWGKRTYSLRFADEVTAAGRMDRLEEWHHGG